jgi:hypothetical protein
LELPSEASINNAFVKNGKTIYAYDVPPEESKCDRIISPRTPRYNFELGCYVKPTEHKIYGVLARLSHLRLPVVVKGFNCEQTGELIRKVWSSFNDPVAVGLDAERFDQTVSVEAQRDLEHQVYLSFACNHQRGYLSKLLKQQLCNTGTATAADGCLQFKITGGRMSGDMNTSSGNCTIMCSLVMAYFDIVHVKAQLINNGDDCVIVCEREDYKYLFPDVGYGLLHFMGDAGFIIKKEEAVHKLEHVEFCQTKPVLGHNGKYRMCRDPIKGIAKDCVTHLDLSSKRMFEAYLAAIGQCGLAIATGMPIFQSFYSRLAECGIYDQSITRSVGWECGFTMMAKGLESKINNITSDTRVSFYEAWGVLPDQQVLIENYYSTMPIRHHIINPESDWAYFRPEF